MKILIVILLLAVVVASQRPMPRMSNGITASSGQFKYQVGLYVRKGGNKASLCTGTLIAPTWILTTADCINGASAVYAAFGSIAHLSGKIVPAVQAVLHSQFDPKTLANDICLLRIPAIDLGSNVAPVALPPLNSDNGYVNENVIASGWGVTSDRDSSSAEKLQYARLHIVSNEVCVRTYGPKGFRNTNICAQGPSGTSTCKGDGGAPLVIESTGVLVGISSYTASVGCTKGYPQGFTRVSSYRSWIKYVTGL